jgi:hypothetical protein
MPYHVALSKEIPPQILDLSGIKEERAYVQCLDPCEIKPVEQLSLKFLL